MSYDYIAGLAIVLLLISSLIVRSRRPQTPVWSIMAFLSFLTILFRLVKPSELESVIDLDVILFLIGMFTIVGFAEASGLIEAVSIWFVSLFKTRYSLLCASSVLFGLLAAIAMNDTVAFMGPPIAYAIARAINVDPKAMFLLLAFSLTIGSVTTPVGNPQNILIVEKSDLEAPFIRFVEYLLMPTLINLFITPFIIIKFFRIENQRVNIALIPHEALKDKREALLAAIGLFSSITALVINDVFQLIGLPYISKRGFIPFIISAALYIASRNPRRILANVDWGTIIFFITMFITMEGVWRSGVLNPLFNMFMPKKLEGIQAIVSIAIISIVVSQIVSNVPFAKLFIRYMKSLGYTNSDYVPWLTLAMASTIAGNLTLLGAASNIIIVEYLESRMSTSISFTEFLRTGVIVTIVNVAIYVAVLALMMII
ncbi:SLC13 family permease [Ignisphaera sp. 4213-co]|uniref:SLC13 family permease n=1 Tax=Ignisphaera cupida TaxID=3050454 RepID=A0ABD4Z4G4_9CREN|nr:SLC13 family permease [Ignisphaera sp. 4213-co]MDK6028201.1 SLC13 family permease [Ignisphaera sp. 4213-co]